MGEWWENRWFRRHAMFVPFGIAITTGLLAYLTAPGPWGIRTALKAAGEMVDLGAVAYAMAAVLIERLIRMWFWALDERRKWREKWRSESRAEGQADLLNQMWAEARAEGNQDLVERLERIASEKGIALGEPLPR